MFMCLYLTLHFHETICSNFFFTILLDYVKILQFEINLTLLLFIAFHVCLSDVIFISSLL